MFSFAICINQWVEIEFTVQLLKSPGIGLNFALESPPSRLNLTVLPSHPPPPLSVPPQSGTLRHSDGDYVYNNQSRCRDQNLSLRTRDARDGRLVVVVLHEPSLSVSYFIILIEWGLIKIQTTITGVPIHHPSTEWSVEDN